MVLPARGAEADAVDLELALKALDTPDDHVVDKRAHEAVRVAGFRGSQRLESLSVPSVARSDTWHEVQLERALGAGDLYVAAGLLDRDAGGNGNWFASNSAHVTTPYRLIRRPSLSCAGLAGHDAGEVETITSPRPPSTTGMSAALVYTRRPGLDTR
jgi:hypothetical protein